MRTCFGMFGSKKDVACQECHLQSPCRDLLLSNGLELVAELLERLLAAAPDIDYLSVAHLDEDKAAVSILQQLMAAHSTGSVFDDRTEATTPEGLML